MISRQDSIQKKCIRRVLIRRSRSIKRMKNVRKMIHKCELCFIIILLLKYLIIFSNNSENQGIHIYHIQADNGNHLK